MKIKLEYTHALSFVADNNSADFVKNTLINVRRFPVVKLFFSSCWHNGSICDSKVSWSELKKMPIYSNKIKNYCLLTQLQQE